VKVWLFLAALGLFWCCGQVARGEVLRFCSGCNFAGAQLAAQDFSGVTYVGTNFEGARLTRASFRGARLVAANFENADLAGASFDAAECTACNFSGAKFDGATFTGARMTAANFQGFAGAVADAQLRSLLSGCAACNFAAASLGGRDLSGMAITGIDFSRADLRNTRFDGSALCWYTIDRGSRLTQCDKLREARVEGASFLGVLICADATDSRTCTPVTADALRRDTGSALDGATLP
jgi:uncharacterized protein YjbI with pentapeptide repeats